MSNERVGQRRTHARALHTPGIAEGLMVTTPSALQVTVAPGVAIDGAGRQMVLGEAQTITLPAGAKDKVAHLYMAYFEEKSDLFFHIVAVLHSPAYRVENAGALGRIGPACRCPPRRRDCGPRQRWGAG